MKDPIRIRGGERVWYRLRGHRWILRVWRISRIEKSTACSKPNGWETSDFKLKV